MIGVTSDKIWNLNELLDFLIANQGKTIQMVIYPEAVCLKTIGLYALLDKFDFTQVTIVTRNPFECHHKYRIYYKENIWLKKIETIDPDLHVWNKNKLFYCLFGRPTASRLGLAAYLHQNHRDITHLHFSATTDVDELVQIELDKLLQYDIDSIESAGTLIKQLPLLLSSPDLYTATNGYNYNDQLTKLYKDILIDVLAESHVSGTTFFPTEKTLRPMWLKKPFVIFASKNYLDYLHQMGFKTFYNFWSEEYDAYEGKERYIRMLSLINTLARMPMAELESMYQNMQSILDHNYNLLLNQTYNNNLSYIYDQ